MKHLILACFCITLMSSTCQKEDTGHERITFKNNSNLKLYVMGQDITYPDTSITFGDLTKTGSTQIVNPNSTNVSALEIQSTWEQRLNHPTQDTLMVFVFDAQVLETTPWDTVKANYLVLKRYDLSLQDLESVKWEITYP